MADISLNELLGPGQIYKIKIIPPASLADTNAIWDWKPPAVISDGFLTNSLSFGTSNIWEGLHNGMQFVERIGEGLKKVETAAATISGVEEGDASGQHIVQGITETIARWSGSAKPTFGFNVMFIKLNPKVDIMNNVITLLNGCIPMEESGQGLKGTMMAPYGYQTGLTGDQMTWTGEGDYSFKFDASNDAMAAKNAKRGTWTIKVGDWFIARGLVMNSANANFSQQCAPDGGPLFAEVQLTFETWRMLRPSELAKFFKTTGRARLI